ncbi:50S ribosomal protein L24 [Candidatus Marsarchaeota G2 archaeon ECH_B_SAG-F08]|jgi:Ribosomal protein L24E|uniref:Large ribosomal subunit protein eL24 n=3 Tax=Candidatus Marsarchaeota TaxID=1978152 RepID=A0A2R6AKC7_9ARCH|nr:MAG: 50S ribosomal protein L24 [Candidatus Marsarchaeota G1 archaeon BE_D]PSN95650.1 MAG: 50S ribosomal protein L24 [Candidatus Marsarchaeota G1 archaeon OSP_B]PSN97906.1 MAG: 50S ribosomal protein L24 [Candidatus Marsarchaeota G2 archaeon ECH_B_SAG-F08]
MAKYYDCSFCGNRIEPGTGLVYVKNDGSILRFCSSKCKKNMLFLKHIPQKTKWTKKYVKAKTR